MWHILKRNSQTCNDSAVKLIPLIFDALPIYRLTFFHVKILAFCTDFLYWPSITIGHLNVKSRNKFCDTDCPITASRHKVILVSVNRHISHEQLYSCTAAHWPVAQPPLLFPCSFLNYQNSSHSFRRSSFTDTNKKSNRCLDISVAGQKDFSFSLCVTCRAFLWHSRPISHLPPSAASENRQNKSARLLTKIVWSTADKKPPKIRKELFLYF